VRRPLAVVLFVLGLLVVACGVPEDDRPQELTADEVPFGLLTTAPTTTTTPENLPPSREAELYFLDSEGLLEPLPREVEDRSPRMVIETLLATDTAGLPATFSSNRSCSPPPTSTASTPSASGWRARGSRSVTRRGPPRTSR
jgi:hypothetical protein